MGATVISSANAGLTMGKELTIIVPVKAAVPNITAVRLDPVTHNLVREGVPLMLNPYDRNALEFALRLKDKYGGRVVTLSMAPPSGKDFLESTIGMGADEAYLITDRVFAGADTLATSYTVAMTVKKFFPSFNLIVMGEETTDSTTAHMPAQVASWLNLPYLYYVVDGEVNLEKGTIRLTRYLEDEGVYEEYEYNMPVIISVYKDSNPPRDISLSRKIQAKLSNLVKSVTNNELKLDPFCVGLRGSPTIVAKIEDAKPIPRKKQIFKGDPREAAKWLIENLTKEGVIRL
ncbi:electron transfer flavoprotein subunit beta/FixA family protein [Caldivirga maquilingensis]|uniref:Electron transfer flavoprotein alpha/beta-subunit n=1 Tax=Caldivirga maquilingensis (strain ATCC 700844 / DSM 13496 / JCM 10307 / IC-167) TaxID=397948 RepID=A8MBX9_CALMQ|nr:Electron transfer flavoprotein alpha/beta-subunit [Caldivirga maquilingensis IC-167]